MAHIRQSRPDAGLGFQSLLSTLQVEHRGAYHGQWDDIVCVSKMAAQVFATPVFLTPKPYSSSAGNV